jgi:hypothetical protein
MVRLNADNSSKKAVCCFWTVFALFEIAVLISSNFSTLWLRQRHRLLSSRPMSQS